MDRIKAAIIGCGGIANGKYLPTLKATGLVEMAGFCDIIEERAQKARDEYGGDGAVVCADYKKLLKRTSTLCTFAPLTAPTARSPLLS